MNIRGVRGYETPENVWNFVVSNGISCILKAVFLYFRLQHQVGLECLIAAIKIM